MKRILDFKLEDKALDVWGKQASLKILWDAGRSLRLSCNRPVTELYLIINLKNLVIKLKISTKKQSKTIHHLHFL